jgi:hypothetical protein
MYGRRQHELQERRERDLGPLLVMTGGTGSEEAGGHDQRNASSLGFFSARLEFAEGAG